MPGLKKYKHCMFAPYLMENIEEHEQYDVLVPIITQEQLAETKTKLFLKEGTYSKDGKRNIICSLR